MCLLPVLAACACCMRLLPVLAACACCMRLLPVLAALAGLRELKRLYVPEAPKWLIFLMKYDQVLKMYKKKVGKLGIRDVGQRGSN